MLSRKVKEALTLTRNLERQRDIHEEISHIYAWLAIRVMVIFAFLAMGGIGVLRLLNIL